MDPMDYMQALVLFLLGVLLGKSGKSRENGAATKSGTTSSRE